MKKSKVEKLWAGWEFSMQHAVYSEDFTKTLDCAGFVDYEEAGCGQTASVTHPGIGLQVLLPSHHLLQHLLTMATPMRSLGNSTENFVDWKTGSGETEDLSHMSCLWEPRSLGKLQGQSEVESSRILLSPDPRPSGRHNSILLLPW